MNKVEDYEYFSKRARNYKLYYDKEVGFFRGRMSDGSWNPVFHPIKSKSLGLQITQKEIPGNISGLFHKM